MNPLRSRKMTWVLTVIAFIAAGDVTVESDIGVGWWLLVFIVLSIVWFMTRRRGRMTCPHCGKDVKKGRTDCKKCGYDFTTGTAPTLAGTHPRQ